MPNRRSRPTILRTYRRVFSGIALVALTLVLSACEQEAPVENRLSWAMGERVQVGPTTYVVVSSQWATQLGEGFQIRSPRNRFLLVNVSITNSGGENLSVPLLSLEDTEGREYLESDDGTGVSNWMGLFREVSPADTKQGRLLFDVPLTSYRLRLPDPNDEGYDRYAYVEIPLDLQMDNVTAPIPTIDLN